MSDLEHRLKQNLETILELPDPRPRISAYHDMPYALFRYDPEDEFPLRQQVKLLETRLEQKGKRVRRISLAQCLDAAMRLQRPLPEWFDVEHELLRLHQFRKLEYQVAGSLVQLSLPCTTTREYVDRMIA